MTGWGSKFVGTVRVESITESLKEWRCTLCGGEIPLGTAYIRIVVERQRPTYARALKPHHYECFADTPYPGLLMWRPPEVHS